MNIAPKLLLTPLTAWISALIGIFQLRGRVGDVAVADVFAILIMLMSDTLKSIMKEVLTLFLYNNVLSQNSTFVYLLTLWDLNV